jgi:hypothetical protein
MSESKAVSSLFGDQVDFGRWAIEAGAAYEVVRPIDDVVRLGL